MIVLDTNVLSEPMKPRPSQAVMLWLRELNPSSVFTTCISQAEILAGVESMPPGKRRSELSGLISRVFQDSLGDRILTFDSAAAEAYAKIFTRCRNAGRPISMADAMIGAIVHSHGATLATRNVEDFAKCGIRVVNPWTLSKSL